MTSGDGGKGGFLGYEEGGAPEKDTWAFAFYESCPLYHLSVTLTSEVELGEGFLLFGVHLNDTLSAPFTPKHSSKWAAMKDFKPALTQHTSSWRPHTDFSLVKFILRKPLFSCRQNPRLSDTVLFLCLIGPKCSHQPNPESTNTLRSCRVYRPTFKCPTQSRCPRFRGALPIFHSWMVFYLFFCRYSADESLLLGC